MFSISLGSIVTDGRPQSNHGEPWFNYDNLDSTLPRYLVFGVRASDTLFEALMRGDSDVACANYVQENSITVDNEARML